MANTILPLLDWANSVSLGGLVNLSIMLGLTGPLRPKESTLSAKAVEKFFFQRLAELNDFFEVLE